MLDIAKFVETTKKLNVLGLRVSQGEELIAQWNSEEECRRNIYSATKSFTSCAMGFAVQERLISIDEKLTDAFMDDLPGHVDENLKRATVRDLLTMCLGQEKGSLMGGQRPLYKEDDWVKMVLGIPFVYAPGTHFVYNNVGVQNINGIDASDIEIVGVSLTYDLAVLRVEGSEVLARSNAVAASFSEDEVFAVGERVYAIGNPQWEGLSATRGIISRESQNIHLDIATTAFRVMRTDAAINGGNSGGGLFNMRGELVGIVNSGAASVIEEDGVTINDIDNMSYALPATYARRVVQSMIDRYEENNRTFYDVRKATLGVTSVVTDSYARYDGELGETVIEQTVAVDSVSAQPAMGVLRGGDILKGFSVGVVQTAIADGAYTQKNSAFSVPEDTGFRVARHYFSLDVERSYTVTDAMFAVRQGDTVEIVIERNGQTMYAYITFDSANYFRTYS